jgi:hypothetical protein
MLVVSQGEQVVPSRGFTAVGARLLELATLHSTKWCNDSLPGHYSFLLDA